MGGGHGPWPLLVAIAVLLALYATAALLSTGGSTSELSAFEPTTDDDDECGPNIGECADAPREEAFVGLAVGDTPGDEAVEHLRDQGFVVFDYFVCSGTSEQGLLRQVRETESGGVVVGSDGRTELATAVEPPDALDVLITSREACNG